MPTELVSKSALSAGFKLVLEYIAKKTITAIMPPNIQVSLFADKSAVLSRFGVLRRRIKID